MANIVIQNTGPVVGTKLHVYMREDATEIAAFDKTTLDAILGGASHFTKIETGFTLEEAEGDSINTTIGQKIVLSKVVTGEFLALGLTTVDYNALMDTSTGYNLQDLDVLLVQAPAERTSGTVEAGDYLYATYKVNVNVRLVVADAAPTKVSLSFERTDQSTDKSLKWDIVLAAP